MIKEAWEVMGFSYLLTIIVSLLVAVVIHGMTVLIRRFGAKAAPLPASAVQEPVVRCRTIRMKCWPWCWPPSIPDAAQSGRKVTKWGKDI